MNILLVKPCWPYPYSKGEYTYNRIWPPLCLANCAALLEAKGHRVTILDAHADRIPSDKLSGFIQGYDKVFISSSTLDKWQCPNIDISYFLSALRKITELTDEAYVTGYHGTVEPEKILELSQARAIIRGEPENTVLEICQGHNLSDVKGLTFKREGELSSTSEREPLVLEDLPVPAFHTLNFKKYFYEILGNNLALFEITRGCKYRCVFCNKTMYGDKARSKSKEQIIEEVGLAIEKYGVENGYFIDLDFLANICVVDGLCDFLIGKRYKFRWTCQTRPESLNTRILERMKSAGCRIIHLGVETASQRLLDHINKKSQIAEIEIAIKLCRKIGIKAFIFILFGLPQETKEDRQQTLSLMKKLNPEFVCFHQVVSYPTTGCQLEESLSDIKPFIRKAFMEYYIRPSYVYNASPGVLLKCLKLFFGRIRTL